MNKLVQFFGNIITSCWCCWSNKRFKNVERFDTTIDPNDIIRTPDDILRITRNIYNTFTWTADGPDQLWDAITPPPENYIKYKSGKLNDDCDGFHSTVYHCLYNSGLECYLLTVNAVDGGHCVIIYKDDQGKWRVIDYTHLYSKFDTIDEAIKDYNEYYKIKYMSKKPFYNALIEYNYFNGKFSRASKIHLK